MEIIKKILNLIFEFFELRRQNKTEREEVRRVIADQKQRTSEMLEQRKKETIKTGTEDNFFED